MGYFNRLLSPDVDRRALGMGLIAAGGPLLAAGSRSLDPGNAGKRIAEAGINFAQTYQTAADRNLILARQAKQLGAAEDFYKLLGQDPNAPYGPVAATEAPAAAPTAAPTAVPTAASTFASTLGTAGSPLLQMPVEEAPVQEVPMTPDESQRTFEEAVAVRPPGLGGDIQEQPVGNVPPAAANILRETAPLQMPTRPNAVLGQPNMVRQNALRAAYFRAFPKEAAAEFGKAIFATTGNNWKTFKGGDGFTYWETGPYKGRRVNPDVELKQTERYRNAITAGLTPGTPEFNAYMLSPSAVTSIDVRAGQPERKQDELVGTSFGQFYIDIEKQAQGAAAQGARLNRMTQLLEASGDNFTGALAPVIQKFARIAKGLGLETDFTRDVSIGEAIESLANDLTLDSVQRTKGAVSENEMKLFGAIAPGLSKTKEGNELIIELLTTVNDRKIKVARMARAYRKEHGRIDGGFYEELTTFHDENPLFTQPLRKRMPPFALEEIERFEAMSAPVGDERVTNLNDVKGAQEGDIAISDTVGEPDMIYRGGQWVPM